MALDIRFAGLSERLQRQLMQAANFIHTSYEKVTVSPWDGTPCALLVADASDPYGQYAIATMAYRGTPVVAVTNNDDGLPHPCVGHTTSTAKLTRRVQGALGTASDTEPECEPLLVRLAQDPALRGRDLDITKDRHTLSLRPSQGRVFADSYSELQRLGNELTGQRWSLHEPPHSGDDDAKGSASASLEAFYVRAANTNLAALPPFTGMDYGLSHWPQLDDTINLRYPVQVIQALVNGIADPAEIARRCNLSAAQVAACLWSFRAAGSLHASTEISAQGLRHRRGLAHWLARLSGRSRDARSMMPG